MYKKIVTTITEEQFDEMPEPQDTEVENEEDVIKLNVPLMIRLLEYAREDSESDIDLHVITEKLVDLSEEGEVLTMVKYAEIVNEDSPFWQGPPGRFYSYPDGVPIPATLPDDYRPARRGTFRSPRCGNCRFYKQDNSFCTKYDSLVRPGWVCNAWEIMPS